MVNNARERVAQAERAVQRRSVNRIARLLEERLDSKSYEQYLGILAAIRADFERFSTLMKKMCDEEQVGNPALHPIDRIVLYIGDLEGCPSDKVVRVLEGHPPAAGIRAVRGSWVRHPLGGAPTEEDASRNMIAEMVPRMLEKTAGAAEAQPKQEQHTDDDEIPRGPRDRDPIVQAVATPGDE
jgi:hypothetical protein